MKDGKKITHIVGEMLGTTLALCVAACLGGIAIALTAKFLMFIFGI